MRANLKIEIPRYSQVYTTFSRTTTLMFRANPTSLKVQTLKQAALYVNKGGSSMDEKYGGILVQTKTRLGSLKYVSAFPESPGSPESPSDDNFGDAQDSFGLPASRTVGETPLAVRSSVCTPRPRHKCSRTKQIYCPSIFILCLPLCSHPSFPFSFLFSSPFCAFS